jgi:uncharacterized protein (TIGR02466 family)
MQTLPLWPVMMYDFQWADHDQYRKELAAVCYDLEAKKHVSNVAPDAKRGLYESGFDFVTTESPAVLAFSHWVKGCFFQAAAAANKKYWPAGMNVSVEIHESWCHITRDGGYHDMHAHPNSSWSAIYYVDTGDMGDDPKNGVNRFYNPHHSMYLDAGTAWVTGSTSIDFQAQPGMLIVFPSWVNHAATVYRGKKDRIVIALNCKITRADMSQVSLSI